ncbi:MAG: polymer-forming cytoskeletal protein [Treponema sp.]|jgi:cytoskeletal protein CcmA (bactofilin family)|nr:polymer-forming cytoskeletal protein [Treponema sp.]
MAGQQRENFSLNTIIGPGTWVRGDIESGGFTRVDGSIQGNISAQGRVIIGEKARVKGHVSGTSVTIGGVVFGNILASERLIVLASALVMGDIITRRIQADEGCLIHGKVMVCQTDEQWDRALAEYQDVQGIRSALAGIAT